MAWNNRVRERFVRSLSAGILALLLVVGGITPAQAGEPPKDAKVEAKARFIAGQNHYNLNEFTDALREFKEGYRLYPDPVFLYNLGQCERQLGHTEEAIRFYRNFLREQPKAANRQEVQNKIAELETALKNKPAEPEKPTPLEPGKPTAPALAPAIAPVLPPPAPPSQPFPATTPASAPTTPAQTLPATPPVSPESAAVPTERVDLTATSGQPVEEEPSPIYKRWWFWTAAAAVAVGAGVGIYAATSGDGPAIPASTLGSKKVF